jgi:serine/threonine protein kinase
VLFDYIEYTGSFSEEVCRYYFHQLIGALEHCHSNNIAHQALQTENIWIDSNYQLKLLNFGSPHNMEKTENPDTREWVSPFWSPERL